jgi:exopolysaccharide production protein ExoZ
VDQQLRSLQALRGVACLAVVALHLSAFEEIAGARRPLVAWTRPFGWAGVDLFFVLSGFIITWTQSKNLGRPAAASSYLFRRLWRIYPVYWVAWMGAVIADFWLTARSLGDHGGATACVTQLLLWPWDLGVVYVGVAWSLTYEVMFYFLFTTFILLPRSWFVGALAGWTVMVLVTPFVLPPATVSMWLPVAPLTCEFLVGCWTALACRRFTSRVGWSLMIGILGLVVGLIYLNLGLGMHSPWRAVLLGPPAGLVVYALTAWERGGTLQLPVWLCRIGDASYSIYLTHWTVATVMLFLTPRWPHTPLGHSAWLVFTLGMIVAIGYVMYLAIERPLLRLTRPRRSSSPVGRLADDGGDLSRAA